MLHSCTSQCSHAIRFLNVMPRLTARFISLRERAASLGVRLTREESLRLARKAGRHEGSTDRFHRFASRQSKREVEREAFLAAIEEPAAEPLLGRYVIHAIGLIGAASYAIGGTQVAGDAGMNVVGCTFVGCVSALGGGTLNSVC